jgi:excisionase family DNA binding protein
VQTLDIKEAAAFLKMHPVTLQCKAKSGEIPGAKPGKCWVFIKEDLAEYIRSQYTTHGKRIALLIGEPQCSYNVKKSGITNSPSVEKQYTELLAPLTKQKPKK